jgi:hypothetical protein
MSVYLYFGATQKGKSYHVFNHVVPNWDKVVIFDPTDSHKGEIELTEPTEKQLVETLRRLKNSQSYRVVIRTGVKEDDRATFKKAASLTVALGKFLLSREGKVDLTKRVQLVIDEASTSGITSSNYFPLFLRKLINKGRHVNVDCHIIAQNPMSIHPQIREQALKIVTFFLNNWRAPIFKDTFEERSIFIKKLPKFWRMEWWDTGEVLAFNEKNQKVDNFLGNSSENPKKKRRTSGN